MKPETKKRARPLLVVGVGIALVTFGGSGCFTSGNLIAQPCVQEDGGPCVQNEPTDAGTVSDGGVLGGDQ